MHVQPFHFSNSGAEAYALDVFHPVVMGSEFALRSVDFNIYFQPSVPEILKWNGP